MLVRILRWMFYSIGITLLACMAYNSLEKDTSEALALNMALSQVTLFADLTGAERDSLQTATKLRHGAAGERIIEQGQILDKMFIILNGQCEVHVNGGYLLTLSGQSLVGEIEFLDGLPASADVILLEETDLIELNNSALINLMEKQSYLDYVIMREIAKFEGQRLRDMTSG